MRNPQLKVSMTRSVSIVGIWVLSMLGVLGTTIVPGDVHVFVDTEGIEGVQNCSISLHEAQKQYGAPLVVPEYPWEVNVYMYTSMIVVTEAERRVWDKDAVGGEVRLYYGCFSFESELPYVCVATSSDGVTFKKPLLPYFPWNGSLPTNRVWQTTPGGMFGNVVRWSGGHGYLLAYEDGYVGRKVELAQSDDGFLFRNLSVVEALPAGFADTQVNLLEGGSNATGGGWTVFGRHDAASAPCPHSEWGNFRRVEVSTSLSPDPTKEYSLPTQALYLGPNDPKICFDPYNPAAVHYHDAWLLFPSMSYHRPDFSNKAPGGERARGNDAVLDVRIATARSPTDPFQYISDRPFLPRGVGTVDPSSLLFNGTGSAPDAGFIFFTSNGILDPSVLHPSSPLSSHLQLYYFATQATHAWNSDLGRVWPEAFVGILGATVRREGFASIATTNLLLPNAPPNGTFSTSLLTIPLCPNSSHHLQLQINARTSTAGWISVAIRNHTTNQPVPGFARDQAVAFKGNEIRATIAWNATGNPSASLTPLTNQAVFFDFHLSFAEVFSYLFVCAPLQPIPPM